MPLRDHFQPPISKQVSWESFHAIWPTHIVINLNLVLPTAYRAEARVHLGSYFEIDVSTFAEAVDGPKAFAEVNGGVATAPWTATAPVLELETDWPEQYEYAVLVFDQERDRRLVAAVELVSPGNKDRPQARRAFVTKCASLLQQGVAVTIVDLVTVRHFNLYAELLDCIAQPEAATTEDRRSAYAAALRFRPDPPPSKLQAWPFTLALGQRLPTLPLWLSPDLAVPLDLEASYEDACRTCRI